MLISVLFQFKFIKKILNFGFEFLVNMNHNIYAIASDPYDGFMCITTESLKKLQKGNPKTLKIYGVKPNNSLAEMQTCEHAYCILLHAYKSCNAWYAIDLALVYSIFLKPDTSTTVTKILALQSKKQLYKQQNLQLQYTIPDSAQQYAFEIENWTLQKLENIVLETKKLRTLANTACRISSTLYYDAAACANYIWNMQESEWLKFDPNIESWTILENINQNTRIIQQTYKTTIADYSYTLIALCVRCKHATMGELIFYKSLELNSNPKIIAMFYTFKIVSVKKSIMCRVYCVDTKRDLIEINIVQNQYLAFKNGLAVLNKSLK